MHNIHETLSSVIKVARKRSQFTMEEIATKVGVTERYMYRIENERKAPSFRVLHKLIQELSISPDLIFYPEKPSKDSEVETLVRMLYSCDKRSMEIITATVKAALDNQPK